MCEPTTAVLAVTAIAGAMSAYSQVQTGRAQAKLANANADAQEQAANDAINTGNDQAYQQRQRTKQLQGQQQAIMGAAGTDATSGNALDLAAQTSQFGDLDALTTINNSQRQAAGLQFQASATRAQGSINKQAANMGAGVTLLNSTLTGASAYKTLKGTTWNDIFKN